MSDRKDFYYRQKPTEAELDEAFDDLEIADWRITSDVIGYGFVVNHAPAPATVQESAVPDLFVRINRFIGYDQLGRRLDNFLSAFKDTATLGTPPQSLDMSTDEVSVSTAVAGGGNEKILSIFVEFNRNLFDPRLDGNAVLIDFEREESVSLNVVQGVEAPIGTAVAPALRTDQLLLADVRIVFAQAAILDVDISLARREDFVLTDKIILNPAQAGTSAYFRVDPSSPPSNVADVQAGFAYAGAHEILDAFTGGIQTTGAFGVVAVGNKRYDLVYLDETGVVQIAVGTEVLLAAPQFDGAPGDALGPQLPDSIIPLAYVLVDETAAVVVTITDIFQVTGRHQKTRDLQGYLIDKGLFGAAPTGTSDDVSALFAAETPSAGSLVGVVTSPPDNYVDLLDQAFDEINHVSGAKVYGRLTEAASVWTLSYFYLDGAGAETAVNISNVLEVAPSPTDLRLVGVRKIFSRNDPARPMFDSAIGRLSDQLVGNIPDATTTVKGKVELAADLETTALTVVQGNDGRLPRSTRILSMVGNVTLLVTSDINQKLDPNGADRSVTLPAATTERAFRIYNTGYFYILRVLSPAGRYVIDVAPGESAWLHPDQISEWLVGARERHIQDLTGQNYSFGADLSGANQFFRPNGQFDTGNAGTVVDGAGSYHVIQVSGTVDEIVYYLGAENQVETLEFLLDGVLARTVSVNGAGDPNNGGGVAKITPLAVTAGQRLAVRSLTATSTCIVQARVRNTTDGYLCQFGGDITTNDAYYGIAENASTNKGATVATADHIVTLYAPVGGGNLTQIAYAIEGADVADQIDVFVGGVLVETVTLANGVVVNGVLVGRETLVTSPFVNGDTLAIRGKDQANMNDAVISLLTDIPGHLIHYKGDPAARVFWEAWQQNVADSGANISDSRAQGMVHRRGRAVLTWYATNVPTAGFAVSRKRERRTRTNIIDTTAGASGTAMVPITFEPEDLVQVSSGDGAEGQTSIAIIIQ